MTWNTKEAETQKHVSQLKSGMLTSKLSHRRANNIISLIMLNTVLFCFRIANMSFNLHFPMIMFILEEMNSYYIAVYTVLCGLLHSSNYSVYKKNCPKVTKWHPSEY